MQRQMYTLKDVHQTLQKDDQIMLDRILVKGKMTLTGKPSLQQEKCMMKMLARLSQSMATTLQLLYSYPQNPALFIQLTKIIPTVSYPNLLDLKITVDLQTLEFIQLINCPKLVSLELAGRRITTFKGLRKVYIPNLEKLRLDGVVYRAIQAIEAIQEMQGRGLNNFRLNNQIFKRSIPWIEPGLGKLQATKIKKLGDAYGVFRTGKQPKPPKIYQKMFPLLQ